MLRSLFLAGLCLAYFLRLAFRLLRRASRLNRRGIGLDRKIHYPHIDDVGDHRRKALIPLEAQVGYDMQPLGLRASGRQFSGQRRLPERNNPARHIHIADSGELADRSPRA